MEYEELVKRFLNGEMTPEEFTEEYNHLMDDGKEPEPFEPHEHI